MPFQDCSARHVVESNPYTSLLRSSESTFQNPVIPWVDAYAPVDKVVHIGGVMVGIPPNNTRSSRHAPRSIKVFTAGISPLSTKYLVNIGSIPSIPRTISFSVFLAICNLLLFLIIFLIKLLQLSINL